MTNTIGLCGIDFIEFASAEPEKLEKLFYAFGFSKVAKHQTKKIDLFVQNDIRFLLNYEPGTHSQQFNIKHGASICSMGWKFKKPAEAFVTTLNRGASKATGDLNFTDNKNLPAIYGIGESLIYFTSENDNADLFAKLGFIILADPVVVQNKGFTAIDHLTNNVFNGTMETWANFYKNIFEFTEVRYFDIRGAKTSLTSYALKSPCGTFCIPINEAKENKSQINEYLEEYKGPGIQHLAFLTEDILSSLNAITDSQIQTLDIEDNYYDEIFQKFPQVTEDHEAIKKKNVLVDGDAEGYLLQIFTKNLIGPIFIEIIQRKNHYSFGEGNFGALFRSIERDQIKRGVL